MRKAQLISGRGITAILLPLLLLGMIEAEAQSDAPTIVGASEVVAVEIGERGGRGKEHLPESLLGLPDTSARPEVPLTDPTEIFSLGLGGVITLGFPTAIVDRPGDDFVIFENAFTYTLSDLERVYVEPGEVSVSRDGVTWQAFPFDSVSLAGAAGRTPMDGRFPLDDERSGGDRFDLADLGVDSVRYVRIRDVSRIVLEDRDHPDWDPTLNGFDLDAVVALHAAEDGFVTDVPRRRSPATEIDLR